MRHADGRTILVVEDERIVARQLQHSLTSFGFRVPETAATADDAIRLASQSCPDLVLMDIQLKGERDGVHAAEVLRARFDVPVVFLTAYADERTLARAKAVGPHGYLVKPVKDADLFSAVEIVLHKKEVERRLRERERWFSTTLRAIGDAVITTDAAGRVSFVNFAAEQLTHALEAHVLGRPLAEVLHLVDEQTRERLDDPVAAALAQDQPVPLSTRALLVTAAGDRSIEGLASPIVGDDESLLGAVLVFRDVGEQRRLQQRIAMADRLSSLGTLVSGIAHEINNPLTLVVANAAHLADAIAKVRHEAGAPGAQLEEAIARIGERIAALPRVVGELQDGADRIRRIVADLRMFSRPQEEARARIELRRVIEWAIRMTASQLLPRAQLVLDLADTPPVEASEVRLGQVFVNLLVNAAQAIPEEQPERNQIHIATSTDEEGRAVVAIRDTGSGMSPEVAQRVFEPFFTTKAIGQGSGLGLAICHGIVTSLGGELTIESSPGRGSTFRIVLPAAPAADLAPAEAVAAEVPAAGVRGRILVIDDDPLLLQVIIRTLEDDHELIGCPGAAAALALLEAGEAFDLILCDLMMPGLTGMDFHQRVGERFPALLPRVVFLTGGAFTARAERFFQEVPNARIDKPFAADRLRAFVHGFIAERR